MRHVEHEQERPDGQTSKGLTNVLIVKCGSQCTLNSKRDLVNFLTNVYDKDKANCIVYNASINA